MICIRPLVFHLPVEHLRRNVRLCVEECGRRTPRTGIVGTRRGGRGAKRSVLASGGETKQKIRSSAGSRDIYRGEVKAARHNRASTYSPSRISFSYPSCIPHYMSHPTPTNLMSNTSAEPISEPFDFVRKEICFPIFFSFFPQYFFLSVFIRLSFKL